MIKINAVGEKSSVEVKLIGTNSDVGKEFIAALEALITPWMDYIEEPNFDNAVAKLMALRMMCLKGRVTFDIGAMKEQADETE